MMKKKKVLLCIGLFLGVFLFCGWKNNNPRLDTTTRPIYEAIKLSDLADIPARYIGQDVIVKGKADDVSRDGRSFVLSDEQYSINVDVVSAKVIHSGDDVHVYGRVDAQSHLMADHVDKVSHELRDGFYFYDGNFYSDGNTSEYSLANGKIVYRVPNRWKTVLIQGEEKEKLIHIDHANCDGYLLNALTGDEQAECFFIFYFSNARYLRYDDDINKIDKIEWAIIQNICSGIRKSFIDDINHFFSSQSFQTSYGRVFDDYVGIFKSHRVEFVFTPAEDGLCVLLYVYNENSGFVDDILYLMRTLETS